MKQVPILTLSDAAARHINAIVAEAKDAPMVRLEVQGGGCQGYQYHFGFTGTYDSTTDLLIEHQGAKLVVDKTSCEHLDGSEIDYSESLLEAGFQVRNPNAKSSCGCGSSFAV